MAYVVRRTNIYLEDRQLDLLNRLARQRAEPVAALVREAIDEWLRAQGIRPIDDAEWDERLRLLLDRRADLRPSLTASDEDIDRDVTEAIRAVREERAAGGR